MTDDRSRSDGPRTRPVELDLHATAPVAALAALAAIALLLSLRPSGVSGSDGGSPSPLPSPSASASPAIAWDSGIVRLTADAIRITAGGQVFTAQVPGISIHSDPGNATARTLEVEWREHDREQRVFLSLAADTVSWWVAELRVLDGTPQADWVAVRGPLWRTAIGGSWHGDVRLDQGPVGVEIDGMTLTAFSPATVPTELGACRPGIDPALAEATDPLAEGQPLAGTGIERMTPAQAKGVLLSMGLCHLFTYGYLYSDGSGEGFGETWCDPPPGVIRAVTYGSDGEIRVLVGDAAPQLHTPRPQPPLGWGC
jgi:hypothetical protein